MNDFTNILGPEYEGREAGGRMSDNSLPGRELEFPRREVTHTNTFPPQTWVNSDCWSPAFEIDFSFLLKKASDHHSARAALKVLLSTELGISGVHCLLSSLWERDAATKRDKLPITLCSCYFELFRDSEKKFGHACPWRRENSHYCALQMYSSIARVSEHWTGTQVGKVVQAFILVNNGRSGTPATSCNI